MGGAASSEQVQAAIEQAKKDALEILAKDDQLEGLFLFTVKDEDHGEVGEYNAVTDSVSVINQYQAAAIILEVCNTLPESLLLALPILQEQGLNLTDLAAISSEVAEA